MSTDKIWYIHINDEELGPFSKQEILDKLASKEVESDDYAYCEGMDDWTEISAIDALQPSVNDQQDSADKPPALCRQPVGKKQRGDLLLQHHQMIQIKIF